jgi:uncharacterized protein (DUF1684 family)
VRTIGLIALLAASTADYRASMEAWRHTYEEGLKAPEGWLSVAGLFWLHEGENRVGSDPQSDIMLPGPAPRFAGSLAFHEGKVRIHPAPRVMFMLNGKTSAGQDLQTDVSGHPDKLSIGSLTMSVIQRGPRTGVRLRDPDSAARHKFSGLHWFPIDEQ